MWNKSFEVYWFPFCENYASIMHSHQACWMDKLAWADFIYILYEPIFLSLSVDSYSDVYTLWFQLY